MQTMHFFQAQTPNSLLKTNNMPVASIGTLGIKYNNRIIKTNLTSPDTITLHKNLQFLKKKKIDNVIIESSSHGLDQKRLDNLKINTGIFTNLSHDHLDFLFCTCIYCDVTIRIKISKVFVDKFTKNFKFSICPGCQFFGPNHFCFLSTDFGPKLSHAFIVTS